MQEQHGEWKQRCIWLGLVALLLLIVGLIYLTLYYTPGRRSPAIEDNPSHTENVAPIIQLPGAPPSPEAKVG